MCPKIVALMPVCSNGVGDQDIEISKCFIRCFGFPYCWFLNEHELGIKIEFYFLLSSRAELILFNLSLIDICTCR